MPIQSCTRCGAGGPRWAAGASPPTWWAPPCFSSRRPRPTSPDRRSSWTADGPSMASDRLGFMQGRLSPMVDGKIQAFPARHWRDEYPSAERLGLPLMEWTLDDDDLDGNPLMTPAGRAEMRTLGERHGVSVETITGDLFMQRPFWRAADLAHATRLLHFDRVVEAASLAGARIVVV